MADVAGASSSAWHVELGVGVAFKPQDDIITFFLNKDLCLCLAMTEGAEASHTDVLC